LRADREFVTCANCRRQTRSFSRVERDGQPVVVCRPPNGCNRRQRDVAAETGDQTV
jgi:hypothetical protein